MTAADAFLLQFDHAWSHKWESLAPVLLGVTDDVASWQAPCYRTVAPTEGAPPPGSIRWQIVHLAHCKREYTARLKGDREGRTPDLPPRPTASLAEDLEALRTAHAAQRTAIAALTDGDLTPGVADFLASTIRHDIWHAGQIAVARRLWKTRLEGGR